VPAGAAIDLSLIRLPEGALIFPSPEGKIDLTRPRSPSAVSKMVARHARKLGFKELRFHDLRGAHETALLDAGVPVHTVAARGGHDPAVLLRNYAKRTRKADVSAAAVIGSFRRAFSADLGPTWVQEPGLFRRLTKKINSLGAPDHRSGKSVVLPFALFRMAVLQGAQTKGSSRSRANANELKSAAVK
jgi:Phage integrase family